MLILWSVGCAATGPMFVPSYRIIGGAVVTKGMTRAELEQVLGAPDHDVKVVTGILDAAYPHIGGKRFYGRQLRWRAAHPELAVIIDEDRVLRIRVLTEREQRELGADPAYPRY